MHLDIVDSEVEESKKYWQRVLKGMIDPVLAISCKGESGIKLGATAALCDEHIAKMEGLSRLFWGLIPYLAGGAENPVNLKALVEAIERGVDPEHPQYWGEIGDVDQRTVESAVYGFGLALMQQKFVALFSKKGFANLILWLDQTDSCQVADSNWHFFPILVQLGKRRAGLGYNQVCIDRHFDAIEALYLGEGWYQDGPGCPKDYYIAMGFHYYSLLYVAWMKDVDPKRCAILLQRAERFAQDYIYMFSGEGAAISFGRSLTYRFTQCAFWSALVYAGSTVYSYGVLKGLIFRNLRWWLQQDINDRDGIQTIGYCYPNLIMAEDYNSPGSPYWSLKSFLFLSLDDAHPFWDSKVLALPQLEQSRAIPNAGQIIYHDQQSEHAWMITSGQRELNNYVNTDAKYTKFAYSSIFGFNLDRGRYGVKHAPIDSMLMLSEDDGYYRGRRECIDVESDDQQVYSHWRPWLNVDIETWLMGFDNWQIRVHRIQTYRQLQAVEGGWTIASGGFENTTKEKRGISVRALGYSSIFNLHCSSGASFDTTQVTTAPNSNIMFAQKGHIPCLRYLLPIGQHVLVCAVRASSNPECNISAPPIISWKGEELLISSGQLSLSTNCSSKILT